MNDVKTNSRRPYRSSLRAAQSALTRDRVMAAALRLMSERGYSGTTVADIAAAADVAVDTIYKAFGSKLGVIQALMDAAGPDAAIAAMRVRWDAAQGRPADQLAAYVHGIGGFWARNEGLVSILVHGTGDAELAALWAGRGRARRELVASLLGTWPAGSRRRDVSASTAIDLVWAMTSNEAFHALAVESGWGLARWEREVSRALARSVLIG
jgi:AcrR family transcriptional regulator